MKIPILSRWLDSRKFAGELEKLPPSIRRFIQSSLPKYTSFERGLATPSNYLALIREYSGWAYACANRNASAVAANPLRLYRGIPRSGQKRVRVPVRQVSKANKERFFNTPALIPHMNKAVDVEEVLAHPWLDLSREVNQFLNGFSLRTITQLYKQVTGNAYWLVAKDQNSVPTSIWVMPAQYVNIVPDPIKFIKGYEYGVEPNNIAFYEPHEVVHFKYPSVKSMYYGLGPMEAAYLAVTLNADFDEFERAILDNGAIIPFVLGTEEFVNDTSIERQRKELMRLHGGFANAGKFAILHSGLKPLPLAWKPTDINYEKGMNQTLQKIFGIFGVPVSKVTENSTRAHAEAANYTYMADTINPLVVDEADMINQNIMPCYDEKLFVAPDNPVPADQVFQLKKQTERQKGGALTINEIREIDGLDPVQDGDTVLVLGTYKPLDQIINPPKPVLPPGFDAESSDAESSDAESSDAESSDADGKAHAAVLLEKAISLYRECNCHNKSLEDTTDLDEFARIERDMEYATLAWIAAMPVIVMPFISQFSLSSMNAYEASTVMAWSAVEESGVATLGSSVVRALNVGGRFAASQVPSAVPLPIMGPQTATNWAFQQAGKRITVINNQTRDTIREIVSEGLSKGNTHTKIATEIRGNIGLNKRQWDEMKRFKAKTPKPGRKEIENLYKDKIRQRSNMIARTETSEAMSEGSINTYKMAGIQKLQWFTAGDACEQCLAFDGSTYPVNDTSGLQPLHPNCRCVWVPVEE